MQQIESVMVVRCELKIPSLGITVRHHSASLVMPNSYPRDGIFNPTSQQLKILIFFSRETAKMCGWMDGLGLYLLLNSISVISGRWKGEHEGYV